MEGLIFRILRYLLCLKEILSQLLLEALQKLGLSSQNNTRGAMRENTILAPKQKLNNNSWEEGTKITVSKSCQLADLPEGVNRK